VDVVYDEFACRNESQDDAWAKRIDIKGRISAQVKLSSGLSVSPDILEPIYANSRLFADIYIDARSSSSAIVAIVTPAASLKDLTLPDGTRLFDFDAICPKDFFSSVEGFRNEIGTQFFTRRRKVQVHHAAAPVAGTVLCRHIAKFLLPNLNYSTIHPRFEPPTPLLSSPHKLFLRLRQFIDAAIVECRSIATGAGLAAHEIPVAFHVDIEPWTVRIEYSFLEMLQPLTLWAGSKQNDEFKLEKEQKDVRTALRDHFAFFACAFSGRGSFAC